MGLSTPAVSAAAFVYVRSMIMTTLCAGSLRGGIATRLKIDETGTALVSSFPEQDPSARCSIVILNIQGRRPQLRVCHASSSQM